MRQCRRKIAFLDVERDSMENNKNNISTYLVESVQDFLIKLDMKPCINLVEISIFSLNHVIVRPTKTPKSADKKMPISDFQSDFSMSKIIWIFLKKIFIEEYQLRGT